MLYSKTLLLISNFNTVQRLLVEAAKKETNSLLRPCLYVAKICHASKSAKSHLQILMNKGYPHRKYRLAFERT